MATTAAAVDYILQVWLPRLDMGISYSYPWWYEYKSWHHRCHRELFAVRGSALSLLLLRQWRKEPVWLFPALHSHLLWHRGRTGSLPAQPMSGCCVGKSQPGSFYDWCSRSSNSRAQHCEWRVDRLVLQRGNFIFISPENKYESPISSPDISLWGNPTGEGEMN